MLSLSGIAANLPRFTTTLLTRDGEALGLRPLEPADLTALVAFLENLSTQTRYFASLHDDDRAKAKEWCDAIARYDKLRFVITSAAPRIVGLLEYSFAITEADMLRYTAYGIALDPVTDCRFGLTLADDYQGRGVGTLVLPFVIDVARGFGKQRLILWGGVFADNARAVRFYEKNGFQGWGSFLDKDGHESFDMLLDL